MASRVVLVALCLACTTMLYCLSCCSAAPAPAPRPLAHALPRPLPRDISNACRCTREFNAVCGNDGQTYSNKCMLNCARAMGSSRMGQGLQVARMGSC